MPSENQVKKAVAKLRKSHLYPTAHRIAELLNCNPSEISIPPLSIEEVKAAAAKLPKGPSIDGICKLLGAPYNLVRRVYLEAGFPLRGRGRPETIDEAENELIRTWKGTDVALAIELGKRKGRTYTKEAIRQKRQKLGVELEQKKFKNEALQELKNGVRPAIVAVRYGYALTTVEAWANEL